MISIMINYSNITRDVALRKSSESSLIMLRMLKSKGLIRDSLYHKPIVSMLLCRASQLTRPIFQHHTLLRLTLE